jgi:hypothetical protein
MYDGIRRCAPYPQRIAPADGMGYDARTMNMRKTIKTAGPVRTWIINHDDSRFFIIAYIGLAVVLSAFVSLFWLVAVVGLHLLLEYERQRHMKGPGPGAWKEALWELRLDFSLVAFAMVVAVYMEYAVGLAGLQLAPRLGRAAAVGARGTARFAAWSRVIRVILLSLDDVAQVLRAAMLGKRKNQTVKQGRMVIAGADAAEYSSAELRGGRPGRWSWGNRLILLFFMASAGLLLLVPVLTDHSVQSAISVIMTEMHPWP